jgi:hypothetical protein
MVVGHFTGQMHAQRQNPCVCVCGGGWGAYELASNNEANPPAPAPLPSPAPSPLASLMCVVVGSTTVDDFCGLMSA